MVHKQFNPAPKKTVSYNISEKINKIKVNGSDTNVTVKPGDTLSISLSASNTKDFTYTVKDGELVVTQKGALTDEGLSVTFGTKNNYDNVIVYVPSNTILSEVYIKTAHGNLDFSNLSTTNATLDTMDNITMNIKGSKNDYSLDLHNDSKNIKVDGSSVSNGQYNTGAPNKVKATNFGESLSVNFVQ